MFRRFAVVVAMAFAVAAGAQEIAPGVDLIAGRFVPNHQPDGNTIVFRAPRGLIVFDTGRHREHTQKIVDFAKADGQPVAAIINSHWHLDHVSGNVLLRQEFPSVRIYASGALAGARKGFLANYHHQLEQMVASEKDEATRDGYKREMATIDAGDILAPDEIVTRSGKRSIAGRNLEVELEPYAVTAGDVWVFDPATRVAAAGDLITLPVPLLDTACAAGWKRALDHIAASRFDVVVPGHGPVMHRREFETYRSAFGALLSCAASKRTNEACIDGWMADAAPLLEGTDPRWVREMLGYYIEQSLRGDPKSTAKLCGEE